MGEKERKIFKSFTMISQIGISMMVPIFLCAGIGWWIAGQFHTQIWFLIMIFIGIGAAFRNVYMLTRSFYSEDMKKEQERLEYIESLKEQGRRNREEVEEIKETSFRETSEENRQILSESSKKEIGL